MTPSDTPITDAETQTGRDGTFHYAEEYVEAAVARKLERRLNEALAELADLKEAADQRGMERDLAD